MLVGSIVTARAVGVVLLMGTLLFAGTTTNSRADIGVLVGPGSFIGEKGNLSYPASVAASPTGQNIYFADAFRNQVLKVSTNSQALTIFAGSGNRGSRVNPQLALDTELNRPNGIAVANDETVYVAEADNNRIMRFSGDGKGAAVFAGGKKGDHIDESSPLSTELDGPSAVALSPDGVFLYVADAENSRILRFTTDGRSVTPFAGGHRGNAIVDNSAVDTELDGPSALAVSDDYVYIAEIENDRVIRALTDGTGVELFAGGTQGDDAMSDDEALSTALETPTGLALSSDQLNLYVADGGNHRVLRFTVDGESVEELIGGTSGHSLDPDQRVQTPVTPTGVATAVDGSLIITDSNSTPARVLIVAPEDEIEETLTSLLTRGIEGTQTGDKGKRDSAHRDLSLLATSAVPTWDPLTNNNEAWRRLRLALFRRIVPQSGDVARLIASYVDSDPMQSMLRLRARLALALLAEQTADSDREETSYEEKPRTGTWGKRGRAGGDVSTKTTRTERQRTDDADDDLSY